MPHNQPSRPDWTLQIYRIRDEGRQQRILSAFDCIGRPGVVAVGVQVDDQWFIVLECGSWLTEMHARRLLTAIDPRAVRTYERQGPADASVDHALLVRSTFGSC